MNQINPVNCAANANLNLWADPGLKIMFNKEKRIHTNAICHKLLAMAYPNACKKGEWSAVCILLLFQVIE